ncbi:MAG: hypothetical protein ABSF24_06625 [Candidatus Bathyarchaeia archaeon]|jgi:hypothetical protein
MEEVIKIAKSYRIVFRSLKTVDFEEELFLARNFLLRVTRKALPSFAIHVSGIECQDRGFYSVPDEERIIKVEAGRREFQPDNYLELFVFSTEETTNRVLSDGSMKAQPILALIHLILGERALDSKIVEDTQELELKFDKAAVEEGVGKTKLNYTSRCCMNSPVIRNEAAFTIVNLFPQGVKELIDSFVKYMKMDELDRKRVNVALRWFYKGAREKVVEDRFLALWISLEAITMQGKTDVRLAKQFLAKMMNIPISAVEPKLEIGRMFGYRSSLVHGEDIDPGLLASYTSKLQNIVEETLRWSIGMETQGKLLKYL